MLLCLKCWLCTFIKNVFCLQNSRARCVQVQELQTIFQFFDVDGSGQISLVEIDHQMSSLGFRVSLAPLQAILEQLNMPGSGKPGLTFPAFVVAMLGHMRVRQLGSACLLFHRLFLHFQHSESAPATHCIKLLWALYMS
jgi:hypothetical protein